MIILGTNSVKDTGFDVANSVRFDDGASSYLQKSASSGNRRTFTFSTWLKRSNLTSGNLAIIILFFLQMYQEVILLDLLLMMIVEVMMIN